ncbi:acetyltransferase [Shewanella algae]|uniref:acetyltransferase n=1 Tax=Shewanella algae TaxID=38313 RepID=UPI0031F4C768
MNKPVIILGAGGHASVLAEILRQQQHDILAMVAPSSSGHGSLAGIPLWQDEGKILDIPPDQCVLVNGIGSLPDKDLRTQIFNRFKSLGYCFATVISPYAIISPHAKLSEGVQVMAGTILQPGVKVAANSIINTGTIIEHDTIVGMNCHLAPRSTLCGGVTLGDAVHIGAGAVIIQGIQIGHNSVIGSGASVNRHVLDDHIVYPARPHICLRQTK